MTYIEILEDREKELRAENTELHELIDVQKALIEELQCTPKQEPPTYCYNLDEESFTGEFATEAEALTEAISEGTGEDARFVWVGQSRSPREFLKAEHLGRDVEDRIGEWLSDEVGEVGENFSMTREQHEKLGTLILNWIEKNVGFHCYGVENIRKVAVPDAPEEETT